MIDNVDDAINLIRMLVDNGSSEQEALESPHIANRIKNELKKKLFDDYEERKIKDDSVFIDDGAGENWFDEKTVKYYYWERLRKYLRWNSGFNSHSLDVLDETTTKTLKLLNSPYKAGCKKGLVVGYVQSGKTANYTALIAKAVDVGYKFVIVLAGMHNSLRMQTNRRLISELVGVNDPSISSVGLPSPEKCWLPLTKDQVDGDFAYGSIGPEMLFANRPILLVVKKNSSVLQRLINWLDASSRELLLKTPMIMIDDESDQASIDTAGSYTKQDMSDEEKDFSKDPTKINGKIRKILSYFNTKSYVAYTATPYANILIPHDKYNNGFDYDLYPKNFIISLDKPTSYIGATELFGDDSKGSNSKLNVIESIENNASDLFQEGVMPESLANALYDFALSAAARIYRGQKEKPMAMMVHVSRLKDIQNSLELPIEREFKKILQACRYKTSVEFLDKLEKRWNEKFRPVISAMDPSKIIEFNELSSSLGELLELFSKDLVRVLNYDSGEVLDYSKEKDLKVIVVGGNKMSRGLTIEGLMVSYYCRATKRPSYDSLMQMGRWFGYREGYADLTKLYTTDDIMRQFRHLSKVEEELRGDIKKYKYEETRITPLDVGAKILCHPIMQVTSRDKRKWSKRISTMGATLITNYSSRLVRAHVFPFQENKLNNANVALREFCDKNLDIVRKLFASVGEERSFDNENPIWKGIDSKCILSFIKKMNIAEESFDKKSLINYIELMNSENELIDWTIAVRGRQRENIVLGTSDWGIYNYRVKNINSSRPTNRSGIGRFESGDDEWLDLDDIELDNASSIQQKKGVKTERSGESARLARSPKKALLLLYPISKFSKPENDTLDDGQAIYEDPENDSCARDLIAFAISLPKSDNAFRKVEGRVREYLTNTVGV